MFHRGFPCGVRQILALAHFTFGADCPKVLDAIDSVNAAHRGLERERIFEVCLNHFNALAHQAPGGSGGRIARQSSELPSFWQEVTDDRAALTAGSSSYKDCPVGTGHFRAPFALTCLVQSSPGRHRHETYLAVKLRSAGLRGPEFRSCQCKEQTAITLSA